MWGFVFWTRDSYFCFSGWSWGYYFGRMICFALMLAWDILRLMLYCMYRCTVSRLSYFTFLPKNMTCSSRIWALSDSGEPSSKL